MQRFLRYFFWMLGGLFFCVSAFAAVPKDGVAPSNPESCLEHFDSLRQKSLQELHKLNLDLGQAYWNARASWEVRYNSQWEALQKKADTISDSRSAEGEVEAGRARAQADRLWDAAMRSRASIQARLALLQKNLRNLEVCCAAWAYAQCLQPWSEKSRENLKTFEDAVSKAGSFWDSFDKKIQASTEEDPSDHTPYGPRMTEPFQIWTEKIEPGLLSAFRMLEASFESELIRKDCCEMCTEQNLKKDQAAQFNPFPQTGRSTIGVGGRILPQKTTGPSLKMLEESIDFKKKEEGKEGKNREEEEF